MPLYAITGASKTTGADRNVTIEAPSEAAAVAQANADGIMVATCKIQKGTQAARSRRPTANKNAPSFWTLKQSRTLDCPACGNTVSRTARQCPSCGQRKPGQSVLSKASGGLMRGGCALIILGLMIPFLVLVLVIIAAIVKGQ